MRTCVSVEQLLEKNIRSTFLDIETIKSLIPFVTFLLGIFASPLTEHLKSRYQEKRLMKGMAEEFRDEIVELNHRIKVMAKSLKFLVDIKENRNPEKGPLKYIPRETLMLFLEKTLTTNYSYLSSQQRNTLKSISTQINSINDYCKKLSLLNITEENTNEIIIYKKKFIYTACCLRYSMQFYLEPKTKKFYRDTNDENMINNQLEEIKTEVSYDDIVIKGHFTLEQAKCSPPC